MKSYMNSPGNKVLRLLAVGPLPPPLGGTTVLFEDFVKRVGGDFLNVTIIDANDRRGGVGRVWRFLESQISFLKAVFLNDVITLHASVTRLVWLGALFKLVSILSGRPVILRAFGGSLDLKYERSGLLTRLAFRVAFSNALVLLETKKLINFFQKKYPDARIDWLPNSRSMLKRTEIKEGRNGRFIFVGHVNEAKGVRTIIDMLALNTEGDICIDVAGPISADFSADELEKISGINYLGVIPSEKIGELIGQYEALVLPTSYEGEGYPGVILEAYAEGTPVVTTHWRSIPEIVLDGHTGHLVPPKDPNALLDKLKMLLSDQEMWLLMSGNALKYVRFFDSDKWHRSKWDEWLGSVRKGK